MNHSKLSNAEDIALRSMWRKQGFLDANSSSFIRNSRFFQWRMNIALAIGLVFIVLAWAHPAWLVSHIDISGRAKNWIDHYIEFRGVMAALIVAVGTYCWVRNVGMTLFWRAYTLLAMVMLALDLQIAAAASSADTELVPSPIFMALRLSLIAIGIANVWHDVYAPHPSSRRLLFWRAPGTDE